MARDSLDWLRILREMGVASPTAAKWAPIFADEVTDQAFSRGAEEHPIFLAQILHESAMLERTEENLSYSAERIIELGNASPAGSRWRSLVPQAHRLARNPYALAEAVYGGRMGNTKPGDGWKYRGGGPGMVTGLDNYRWIDSLIHAGIVEHPERLRDPRIGMKAFIAFWENRVADATLHDNLEVTLDVNGGKNGLKERARLTALAQGVMA